MPTRCIIWIKKFIQIKLERTNHLDHFELTHHDRVTQLCE